MSAGTHNFTIEQGSKWERTLTYKDSDGDAIDLTGYSARMQIRSAVGRGTLHKELTTTGGEIAITGASGIIALTLTATETAALDFTKAHYDLELVPSSGEADAFRLLEGTVTLDHEVTV